VRRADFEDMVRRMAAEIPAEFLEGVAEIAVSPRTVPHPDREGIYTLGECVPLPAAGDGPADVQSRVVLYHGSFAAVARDHPDFDWREEAWETLTHEVRHHVEWRARAPDLEQLDQAAEQNYARHDGEAFDPGFYRDGERLPGGVFRVEDDYFIELDRGGARAGTARFHWGGRAWRVRLPRPPGRGALFLSVGGLPDPPPGELVLVVPPAGGLLRLLARPGVVQAEARATPEPEGDEA
jgi:hypothetical protein